MNERERLNMNSLRSAEGHSFTPADLSWRVIPGNLVFPVGCPMLSCCSWKGVTYVHSHPSHASQPASSERLRLLRWCGDEQELS